MFGGFTEGRGYSPLAPFHLLMKVYRFMAMKKHLILFFVAFGLNWFWENLHQGLYVHYQNQQITEFVLSRAAFWDALIILVSVLLLNQFQWSRRRPWLLLISGLLIGTAMEWWALGSGRWAYNEFMPLVPLAGTGLSPTVQLALTGYFSHKLIFRQLHQKTEAD